MKITRLRLLPRKSRKTVVFIIIASFIFVCIFLWPSVFLPSTHSLTVNPRNFPLGHQHEHEKIRLQKQLQIDTKIVNKHELRSAFQTFDELKFKSNTINIMNSKHSKGLAKQVNNEQLKINNYSNAVKSAYERISLNSAQWNKELEKADNGDGRMLTGDNGYQISVHSHPWMFPRLISELTDKHQIPNQVSKLYDSLRYFIHINIR